jgi:hypothetical protein
MQPMKRITHHARLKAREERRTLSPFLLRRDACAGPQGFDRLHEDR